MDFTVCYSITFLTNNQWVVLVLIAVNVCSGSCGVIMAYYLDSLLVIATAEGIERQCHRSPAWTQVVFYHLQKCMSKSEFING